MMIEVNESRNRTLQSKRTVLGENDLNVTFLNVLCK